MRWYIKQPNKYVMIQWGKSIFLSLGIHIDFRRHYADLHLGFIIITIGNPKAYEEYQAWWSSRNLN